MASVFTKIEKTFLLKYFSDTSPKMLQENNLQSMTQCHICTLTLITSCIEFLKNIS